MQLIHRDISINNILIYDDPEKGIRGLLIDWEYAKTVEDILSKTGAGWRSVSTASWSRSNA
jgi:hypothetical protein